MKDQINVLRGIDDTVYDMLTALRRLAGAIEVESGFSVPGFASGGDHMGGLRIVGEHGPEIEATGPARIVSNNNLLAAVAANAEAVAEIRRLREEMRQGMYAVAKNTSATARQLQRWDGDGLPEQREVEA
jgi:hypothetical protein